MALAEFLMNVRTAAVFFSPHIDFENPRLRAEDIPEARRHKDIWLTPRVVEGFDPDEFTLLPPDKQDELTQNVRAFADLAQQFAAAPDLTDDQVREIGRPFIAIVSALRPNLDPRWIQVHRAVREALPTVPEWVVGVFPAVDTDWATGEEVIRVYVTVDDRYLPGRHVELTRFMEKHVRETLLHKIGAAHVEVGLIARSEMPEVIGAHGD